MDNFFIMKRIGVLITLLVTSAVLTISSCSDDHNCIDGNHQVTIEIRNFNGFKGIVSEGHFNIEIIQDTVWKVIIEAESNFMDYIGTRVHGNTLEIDTKNNRCLNNHYPIKITIHTPDLEMAAINGSGNLYCDMFNTPQLFLDIVGSGNIYFHIQSSYVKGNIIGSGNLNFSGNCIEGEFNISGSGSVFSYDLPLNTCFINITGSGNTFVNVSDLLDVNISGSGNVYYLGNPVINSTITGSGSIIHGK